MAATVEVSTTEEMNTKYETLASSSTSSSNTLSKRVRDFVCMGLVN